MQNSLAMEFVKFKKWHRECVKGGYFTLAKSIYKRMLGMRCPKAIRHRAKRYFVSYKLFAVDDI